MHTKLSLKQKEICNKSGKFVVSACAGSGKTFTISKKMVNLINQNKNYYNGVAVLSFTNVAWKEIRNNLNNWGFSINYPHFLGTIDSFINKYIFYQYYYLLDEFDKRPILVGEPSFSWKVKNHEKDYAQYFDNFIFDINGDLIKKENINLFFKKFNKFNKDGNINKNYSNLLKMKNQYFLKGYVTQADINYFSLLLLKKFPFISKIIAKKFSSFLVDEAQDTSEIQMNILNIILEQNNIENFIFVGDFDQAIFEWNDASPDLFKDLSKKYETIKLNENWRSSQNICDFTSKIKEDNYRSVAVDENVKDYPYEPKIIGYNNFDNLINYFLEICGDNHIEIIPNNVAILTRSKNLLKEILGVDVKKQSIWNKKNFTFEIVYSKFLYDNFQFKKAFRILSYVFLSFRKRENHFSYFEIEEFIKEVGFFEFNESIINFLNLMPNTSNKSLLDWIKEYKLKLSKSDISFKNNIINNLSLNEDYDGNINSLFSVNETNNFNYQFTTIHKVKGETFDAVMLILKSKVQKKYETIINDFKNNKIKDEELRNIYVAITRPKKVLVLAVPSENKEIWEDLFYNKQKSLDFYF